MQQLKQLYRSNYAGENIVSTLTLAGGEWTPETEFVPNRVINTHTTSQAVCIGNGESRKDFNLRFIGAHRGGLLAADKLQSYGCNALYRDFAPDFLIAVGNDMIDEIANSDYCANNIVYTNAVSMLQYPGKFYLIPQNISFDAGAIAAYMACFDGHKKVFLLGYDQYDDADGPYNNMYKDTNGYLTSDDTQNSKFLTLTLSTVIQAYNDVDFVRVMPTVDHWISPALTPILNFRQISYNDFVYEADIGAIGAPGG